MQTTWQELQDHHTQVNSCHLKTLLQNEERNNSLVYQHKDVILDLTHEKINPDTIQLLQKLANTSNVQQKLDSLLAGEKVNCTENRAVLHTALRAPLDSTPVKVGEQDVLKDVHTVLGQIKEFSNNVRSGVIKGFSGKSIKNLVVIGIGGSYLSIEFVHQSILSSKQGKKAAQDRQLRFLANVDPVDFTRAVQGLNAEETLILVNSKTFTTAETILNAKTVKNWLLTEYQKTGSPIDTPEQINAISNAHLCACSTNLQKTGEFGINPERVFAFWDFVGGRYSVWSAIGILPLSLQYGFDVAQDFLNGGGDIDNHLLEKKENSLPYLLALIGFYNTAIAEHSARAILPYSQALQKFVPHIQQLDMESNGKRVDRDGKKLAYECTGINFGEPGTNGQHSFYQLLHQGRVIPCEFIGFIQSQQPIKLQGESISNHEELMSNFFSQPDALAQGKDADQLKAENVAEHLIGHMTFPGDRPSLSLLMKELNAFSCGQLLALYEYRTVIEGFMWNINSFDQFGVELGKQLAKGVRGFFQNNQGKSSEFDFSGTSFNSATKSLIQKFQVGLNEQ